MRRFRKFRAFHEQHPLLALTFLGVVSEAVYLVFTFLYPLTVHGRADRPFDLEQLSRARPWAAVVYAVGLVVLFLSFWAALRITQRVHIPSRLIISFGMIFGTTLIWLYPVTANDLFRYVMRARVRVVYGENPMIVPPSHFPDDPLLPFTGEWANNPSPYGPIWELVAEGIAWLGPHEAVSGALAYKGFALITYLACTGLLAWGVRKKAQALLFFAWSPLILLQGLGNGHNDLFMMFWVLLSFLLWERKQRWLLSVVALTLAALTKLIAAFLIPLLIVDIIRSRPNWRQRIWVLSVTWIVAFGLGLLAYAPFWPPWESLTGVLGEFSYRYSYTIVSLLRAILKEYIPNQAVRGIPRTVGRIVFVMVYVWMLVRLWRRRTRLAEAGCLIYFAYLLTATSYRIWYPLWLVPLASLYLTPRTRLRVFLLCLTSELSILMYYLVWRWLLKDMLPYDVYWLTMYVLTVPWQFGLPLLLPLWQSRSFLEADIIHSKTKLHGDHK